MSERDDLRRLAAGKFGVSITSARLLEVLDALEAAEARLAAVARLVGIWREDAGRTPHPIALQCAAILEGVLAEGMPQGAHNRRESDEQAQVGPESTHPESKNSQRRNYDGGVRS